MVYKYTLDILALFFIPIYLSRSPIQALPTTSTLNKPQNESSEQYDILSKVIQIKINFPKKILQIASAVLHLN